MGCIHCDFTDSTVLRYLRVRFCIGGRLLP